MAEYRKEPIVPLETARLRLRPLEEADAPRVQLLFPTETMLRYMNASIPWPYPEDGALAFIRCLLPEIEAREVYSWAILRKGHEDEGLVGAITLTPASDENHRGFWLGEPYWGQGLMKEAVIAVNDFAFDVLEMRELLLDNAEPNVASHRLKASMGAEIIARGEERSVGGTFPSVRWRLTREAWRAYRNG